MKKKLKCYTHKEIFHYSFIVHVSDAADGIDDAVDGIHELVLATSFRMGSCPCSVCFLQIEEASQKVRNRSETDQKHTIDTILSLLSFRTDFSRIFIHMISEVRNMI